MVLKAPFVGLVLAALAAMGQAPAPGARVADTGTVTLLVDVRPRTSLRVSTSQLRFDLTDQTTTSRLEVEYRAAARSRADGPVTLTVERVGAVRTPEGESVRGLVLRIEGEGHEDTMLAEAGPHVAGRWAGSGVRSGRLAFTLLGARRPGTYLLDLKFVLSEP